MNKGNGNIWKKKRQGKQASTPPAVLYLTCSELPFDRFINCACKREYAALIKTPGVVDYGELVAQWQKIQLEFIDLNSDNEVLYIIRLEKEINVLREHIRLVDSLLTILSTTYHPLLVVELKKMGYDYPFDPKDLVQYNHSFTCIDNRLAGPRFHLQQKYNEYSSYIKNKNEGTTEEAHFHRQLIRLAKHRGVVAIRAKDIFTDEFVFMWQDYLQDLKAHSELMKKHG